jgi:hypothetical protein
MILFTILLLMLIFLTLLVVLAVSIGGTIGIVLFGDVIVCILLIVWIIKRIIRKRQK